MKRTMLLLLLFALGAGPAFAAEVTLAWDYSGAEHQGFKLRYKPQGGEYQMIDAAIAPEARQYTHVNAPMGTILYKLTAFDDNGESAGAYVWGVVEAEPSGPPAAPNMISITVTVTSP